MSCYCNAKSRAFVRVVMTCTVSRGFFKAVCKPQVEEREAENLSGIHTNAHPPSCATEMELSLKNCVEKDNSGR